ncbi:MAG: DUF2116 family Zn-ribbon domain-containing protein [Candidatus Methanomethylophilaceae archaeon]|nr:DUF2116 family Zn-ribbon domain-containing protein [Candidatus Methanomethylophilaceae archaeon]
MAGTRLPDHSHCKYCGEPIEFGKEYCGEICEESFRERERGDRRKEIAFYAAAAVSVIVILAAGFLLRSGW